MEIGVSKADCYLIEQRREFQVALFWSEAPGRVRCRRSLTRAEPHIDPSAAPVSYRYRGPICFSWALSSVSHASSGSIFGLRTGFLLVRVESRTIA
jgi:hypothetical protein